MALASNSLDEHDVGMRVKLHLRTLHLTYCATSFLTYQAVATQWSPAHLAELQAARSELQAARSAAALEARPPCSNPNPNPNPSPSPDPEPNLNPKSLALTLTLIPTLTRQTRRARRVS